MKKIFILIFLSMTLPLGALASTLSFPSSSVSVTSGQMINVPIYLNPSGNAVYTVKAVVSFSPDILEVRSFSFSSTWLPLSQPGYDKVDNSSGTLIKTAGYAGGLSSNALFGTVTFYAKRSGTALVSVTNGTQVLNATNQNTFTSGGELSV